MDFYDCYDDEKKFYTKMNFFIETTWKRFYEHKKTLITGWYLGRMLTFFEGFDSLKYSSFDKNLAYNVIGDAKDVQRGWLHLKNVHVAKRVKLKKMLTPQKIKPKTLKVKRKQTRKKQTPVGIIDYPGLSDFRYPSRIETE